MIKTTRGFSSCDDWLFERWLTAHNESEMYSVTSNTVQRHKLSTLTTLKQTEEWSIYSEMNNFTTLCTYILRNFILIIYYTFNFDQLHNHDQQFQNRETKAWWIFNPRLTFIAFQTTRPSGGVCRLRQAPMQLLNKSMLLSRVLLCT